MKSSSCGVVGMQLLRCHCRVNRQSGVKPAFRFAAGLVTLELVVAMGILATTMLPLAYSVVQEQRAARGYYFRAVAMEIVDGEMEVLLAGHWRAFPKGSHPHTVRAESARNLPPGQFLLSVGDEQLALEWRPAKPGQGGPVRRTVALAAAAQTQETR